MRSLISCFCLLLISNFSLASSENGLHARKPFARATASTNGAVFLMIENPTSLDYTLQSAATPVAEHCELHETSEENGISKMRHRPEGMTVPAHGHLYLKPGGLHVMLMNLKEPLKEGSIFDLTLLFDKGKKIDLTVPVRSAGATCCGCDKAGLCS